MRLKLHFIFVLLAAIAVSAFAPVFAAENDGWVHIVPRDIAFDVIKGSGSGNEVYTIFGNDVIIHGGENFSDEVIKNKDVESFPVRPTEKLYLVNTKDPQILKTTFAGVRVIYRSFGFMVVLANETAAMGLKSKSSDFTKVSLLPENETVVEAPKSPKSGRSPRSEDMKNFLSKIDMEAFFQDLEKMVSFKTRYSYVAGAQKAVDHFENVMKELGLSVKQVPFRIGSTQCNNLVGTLKGTDEEKYGQIIVLGHLDSISRDPRNNAPGADDNGSGSAGVIALARLLKVTGLKPKATIKFALLLGEEQGLYGSKAYAREMTPAEKKATRAVLNMDMIGFDRTPPLSIMMETSSAFKPLAEKIENLAAEYTSLTVHTSYHAWGSDHVPFIQQNVPAVLTIESEFEANHNYHQVTDLIKDMNPDLCKEIVTLNAATMYEMGVNP